MHTRKTPTVEIPLSKLRIDPDFDSDQRMVQLYVQLGKGEIDASLTRLPIHDITSGSYIRKAKRTVRVSNLELKAEFVSAIAHTIRSGTRHMLDLYWSPLAPRGGGYVCPDDEVALAAYASLNIQLVPCRILRPKNVDALEGAIWVKYPGTQASPHDSPHF